MFRQKKERMCRRLESNIRIGSIWNTLTLCAQVFLMAIFGVPNRIHTCVYLHHQSFDLPCVFVIVFCHLWKPDLCAVVFFFQFLCHFNRIIIGFYYESIVES